MPVFLSLDWQNTYSPLFYFAMTHLKKNPYYVFINSLKYFMFVLFKMISFSFHIFIYPKLSICIYHWNINPDKSFLPFNWFIYETLCFKNYGKLSDGQYVYAYYSPLSANKYLTFQRCNKRLHIFVLYLKHIVVWNYNFSTIR